MSELANNPIGEGADAPDPQELANQPQPDGTEVVEGAEQGQPVDDDTEEVEYEGKKYTIAKPLKSALLFHADYTRKTQEVAKERTEVAQQRTEVAQQRTELQERSRTLQQQAESQQAFIKDVAKVEAYNDAIEQYEKLNWADLRRQDAATTDQLWFQYQQTLMARNKAAAELQTKMNERSRAEAEQANRFREEGEATLRGKIKDWSPDTRGKVSDFVSREFGVQRAVLDSVNDPVLWQIAHRAFIGDQAIKQAAKAAAAARTAEAVNGVKPVPQVGSNASSTAKVNLASKEAERIDADEWARRRNQELRNRA